jgi:predicted transcriptional regulator
MDTQTTKTLLAKLRQPIHINYIASHILKISEHDTRNTLKMLLDEDVIEESTYAKDYYVIKKK